MGLREYVVRRQDIKLPDQSTFSVRGLNLGDVTRLVGLYSPLLTKLFDKFISDVRLKTLSPEVMGQVISEVLTDTPEIAYMVIEIGSDEPGTAKTTIPTIGIIAQAEALSSIVELTLLSEAEVKKLVEIVTKAMGGTAAAMDGLNALRSAVQSGASGGQ